MFGLIRKKDLAAFAERVHNDNALDARMDVPMKPVSYEDHKKAAYYNGYVDGSRALLFALRAFMFGGKRKPRRCVGEGFPLPKARGARKDGRRNASPTGRASICREFETIVTVQIHDIDKNVELPLCFNVDDYKAGVEQRIRRALEASGGGDAYTQVKVQVFMKDEREC